MNPQQSQYAHPLDPQSGGQDYRFLFFSELLKRKVCAGNINNKIGVLSDLVFNLSEHYPEAVGIYLEFGWGKPTQFIPWDKVIKIENDAIFVKPPETDVYPPFVDQKGWILVNQHFMGRTILDMDGRRIEVVNDVHLLESKGRMIIVHVDISFNGFLRKWHLGKMRLLKDQLISWKFVQPLSLEDSASGDTVSLSQTKAMVKDLPSEDLADALEQLSGREQQAFFSALDSEAAADALVEAEPRAQRQIIASLRSERARTILSEMSVPQLADLFSVLSREHVVGLMALLPEDAIQRINLILAEREGTAKALMSSDYLKAHPADLVGEVLKKTRNPNLERAVISYIYIVDDDSELLVGVVDIRDLMLAPDNVNIGSIMTSPVVTAEVDDTREDLADIFAKYFYRMIPVVSDDQLLGVVHYKDVIKGLIIRAKS